MREKINENGEEMREGSTYTHLHTLVHIYKNAFNFIQDGMSQRISVSRDKQSLFQ